MKTKLQTLFAAVCLAAACAPAQPLADYADPSTPAAWRDKLRALERGENITFRIVQVGDSHTAGGFFTDELRRRLQQRWGNGGIGWVFPQAVKGQRSGVVRYQGGWTAADSRKDQADFPFGGVLARSAGGGTLTVSPVAPTLGVQKISVAVKPVFAQQPLQARTAEGGTPLYALHGNVWQYFDILGSLPLLFQAAGDELWEVGGINIENGRRGAVVSALGLNGSQWAHWQRWRPQQDEDLAATRADLLIIAYGTNEAFNDRLDLAATGAQWRETLRRIKRTLPEAGIIVVGAPESLKSTAGACGVRPPRLDAVQALQQRVAREEGVLYWSWQEAAGGRCGMNAWVKRKLAAADGVHFSAEGYRQAAAALADAIVREAE